VRASKGHETQFISKFALSCFFFGFPERLQRMTAVAMCTVSITVLEPRAFNAEFQYFIP